MSTAPLAPPLAAEATKVSWRYRPSIVAWHCWFLAQLVQLACGSQLSLLGGGQHVCIPPFLNNEQSLGSKPNTTSLLRSQDGTQGRSPQRCGFCQIHSPPRSPRASTGFSSPSPGEGLRGRLIECPQRGSMALAHHDGFRWGSMPCHAMPSTLNPLYWVAMFRGQPSKCSWS